MQAATRGKRITTLRHLLGINQTELASVSGISQSQISLMEKGERSVTDAAVTVLSSATRMPMSYFDMEPADPRFAPTFRKLASSSAASRDAAIARFGEAERISSALGDALDFAVPSLPLAEDDLSGDDIEYFADATRRALRLEAGDPVRNLTRAMERQGIATVPLVEDGDPSNLMSGHDGISRPNPESQRPVIGYIPGQPGDRDRFTKAHELGHLVLHSRRPWVLDKIKEREAHRFAGALLFPDVAAKESIQDELSLNGYLALKAQWGLSIAALISRGYSLGNLSEARRKSLMVQMSYKGWRKSEPVHVGNEKPLLLRQALVAKYGRSPYMRAANDLGMRPDFLREWIPGIEQEGDESAVEPLDVSSNVRRLFG
ncbi:XRE family transcriptional regulator [Arthrobacter sp. UYCu712]|uniref:helix-turn-helix domain-containing protein n=1 Tax=Arthrobacter sp. UYCu712 TaxID=3156340 RepID=UPI003399B313